MIIIIMCNILHPPLSEIFSKVMRVNVFLKTVLASYNIFWTTDRFLFILPIITHMLELPWHLFITSVHLPTPLNKNKSGRGESLSPILSQGVGRYTQICACYHRRLNYSTSRLFKSTAFWHMSLPWLLFFFTQNYTCCGMKNGATSICRCFKVLILCHCYNWKTCLLLSFAASHNYAAMLMTSF